MDRTSQTEANWASALLKGFSLSSAAVLLLARENGLLCFTWMVSLTTKPPNRRLQDHPMRHAAHFTVTDLAKFLGKSGSAFLSRARWYASSCRGTTSTRG